LERFLLAPKDFVNSPEAMAHRCSIVEAEAYTRWLATHHYENFHVVSFLLPKRLHQDFYNVYAFCRWADDLADEIGDKDESLRLLAWWQDQLDGMYAGVSKNPVYVALDATVRKHNIPRQPFADLIRAFIQDQKVSRYRNWDEVHDYCRYSANPVGHLVLYLCGYSDTERQRLSDATCTALQLANFWQDVAVDLKKDRVYIPLEVIERHGYSVAELFAHKETPQFRAVMKEVVDHARTLFLEGIHLPGMVDRRLAIDLDLFSRGGLRVLEKIEGQNYNVLSKRPAISKGERVMLLLRSLTRVIFRSAA
jgi:squalene synthase HpnC